MRVRWSGRVIGILVAVVIVCAVTLLASLWIDHRSSTELPKPTGSYAIGRVIEHWVDDSHADTLAPVPNARRELVAWIWYPAAANSHAKPAEYIPAPLRAVIERRRPSLINFLTRDLARVRTHSVADADLSPNAFPVVIMRAGASSEIWNYSTLAEDLASHGYVVVGFDAPYRTGIVVLPDGRVIERTAENNGELCESRPEAEQDACVSRLLNAWTSDIAFALEQLHRFNVTPGKFAGHLDMSRVGVFGHSLGGATAAQFCHDDARCKAAIDIDGRPFGSAARESLRVPFLFLLGDHSRENDPASLRIKAQIQSMYDRLPRESRSRVVIRGANHFFFADDLALLKSHIVLGALRLARIVKIDGRRQLAATCCCVHTFFDAYLMGNLRFDPSSSSCPEIEVIGDQ